jgi:hypothetical protein
MPQPWSAKINRPGLRQANAAARRLSFRPALEALEDRCVPTTSSLVYPGGDGNMIYAPDARANRIEDFSNVGYLSGTVALPDTPGGVSIPVRVTLSPGSGDQTAAIQAAINQVSQMPLDANGYRGTVLLQAGEYAIGGQLTISASGVVLLGQGTDASTGTRLRATGTSQRTLVFISGSGSRTTVSGTTHNVIDNYVPVGAISFHVDSTAGLNVGDTIEVNRPSPANWISDIGMDQLINPWIPGSKNLHWDRVITRIEGNLITVDAPLTNSLEQQYGGGTINKYTWSGRLEKVGVENLRGFSDFTSSTDENHSWQFIEMAKVENSWVHDVISQYFAYGCVEVDGGAKWITVQDTQCLDPISIITGGRRYSFSINGGEQCLFRNLYSRNARHDFTIQSTVAGPNVFVDCHADLPNAESGPHQRWSTGTLMDNISLQLNHNSGINIRNAGNEGTGHGWQGANYVIWNSTADTMNVYSPPTAQNWVIGGSARASGTGIFDAFHSTVTPRSLYYQQLGERQAIAGLSKREYWVGDNDNFTPGDPADSPFVDPGWLNTVNGAVGTGQVVTGFDDTTPNTWIPFSFQYALAPGEQVVGASLSLGVLRTGGNDGDDNSTVYINSLSNSASFGALGWLPLSSTTPQGVVMDLSNQLSQLQSGLLNVAVAGFAAIDWAVLDIKVAPVGSAPTQVNLSTSFNRIGIVHDGAIFSGGIDGSGYAYSAESLGSTVTSGGATFNLGTPGGLSAVSAVGQTITLPPGNFRTLAFLAAGTHGNQVNQTFVVTYTDGTTATFTQSLSDWLHPQSYSGESIAASMTYRDRGNGTQNTVGTYLYRYSFQLDSSKIVSSITLPNNANVEILAMDLLP